jgi:mannose-6-phosphate isomerase-like protein (cupin superfamily)
VLGQPHPGAVVPTVGVRRVVTGHDASGASVVVSDGAAPRSHAYRSIPGLVEALLWATDGAEDAGAADPTPAVDSYVPPPGGTRMIWLRFPPDAVLADPSFDAAAARDEQLAVSPGLAERFEPDAPGMHATPTVDYAVVVEGELWLELDGGVQTRLGTGDVVVQNGTRHAWRNRGEGPATLLVILVGRETR